MGPSVSGEPSRGKATSSLHSHSPAVFSSPDTLNDTALLRQSADRADEEEGPATMGRIYGPPNEPQAPRVMCDCGAEGFPALRFDG